MQYLFTYCDPETGLPVLLMELCNENLSKFLERSPGPLPFNTQLNISHDITLALVYLHANGLIHRDLTGNNVLMIAGTRAKITDFGMSKLANVNPCMTALTLCPGNALYMSPEALDEPPTYTDKLDVFSFGVLLVQIMTRQFPNPDPRFKVFADLRFSEGVRVVVPETQRRQIHLDLILDTHPLKSSALQCLKNKDKERPSAFELSERLSSLKFAKCAEVGKEEIIAGKGEVNEELGKQDGITEEPQQQNEQQLTKLQELEKQLHGQRILADEKTSEVIQLKAYNDELQKTVEDYRVQLQETQRVIETKEREILQKDSALSDLRRALSIQEGKKWLEQQQTDSSGSKEQLPVTRNLATASAAQKDVTNLRWREGQKAPHSMYRGAAAAYENLYIAYFNVSGSHKVYSYQMLSDEEEWSLLPESPYKNFGLAIVDGLLTTVGGTCRNNVRTSSLLSLTVEDEGRKWSNVFPPMPTACSHVAAISTSNILIVAGGFDDNGKRVHAVKVMNISKQQWTTANRLPQPLSLLSAAICGDQLYLAGGFTDFPQPHKSVLTCSLADLLPPQSLGASLRQTFFIDKKTKVWKEVSSLPVARSTLVTFGAHLLALGGQESPGQSSANVYQYNAHTDSWSVVSRMTHKRSQCLAAVLPGDQLIAVGGFDNFSATIEIVDIAHY